MPKSDKDWYSFVHNIQKVTYIHIRGMQEGSVMWAKILLNVIVENNQWRRMQIFRYVAERALPQFTTFKKI